MFKKIIFTSVTFLLFLIVLEVMLALTPLILGFTQGGSYERILNGGTTIICLGDSVTYGYGLEANESWPTQLKQRLHAKGAQISVFNRGLSGMDSTEIIQRELHIIKNIAKKGSRLVVLVMIGHNDLAGRGWRQWSAPNKDSPGKTSLPPPRLWRIFRWATSTQENSSWRNPKKESLLKSNILLLSQEIQKLNGQVYLLTYLLPGTAEKTNPRYASDISLSRALQGRGNDIMRSLSNEYSTLRLIDIDTSIQTPKEWDPAWFQDHIHPTAPASLEISASVQRHLVSYGELPISVLP
jgi:lysophospholipase L1-like esterase